MRFISIEVYQSNPRGMSLLLVLTLFTVCYGINLDEGVQSYVNSLVVEFEKSPKESRFVSVLAPPLCLTAMQKGEFLLPKVFMWSPCEQFQLKVERCLHEAKRESARLMYDLYGNVVLVQRIYVYVRGRLSQTDVCNT